MELRNSFFGKFVLRKLPYESILDDTRVAILVSQGITPDIPADAPDEFTSIMQKCWNKEPSERPGAVEIAAQLQVLLNLGQCKFSCIERNSRSKVLMEPSSKDEIPSNMNEEENENISEDELKRLPSSIIFTMKCGGFASITTEARFLA